MRGAWIPVPPAGPYCLRWIRSDQVTAIVVEEDERRRDAWYVRAHVVGGEVFHIYGPTSQKHAAMEAAQLIGDR